MPKKTVIAFLMFATAAMAIVAHPHVSMDARLEFEFDGASCVGMWQEWTLDPFFSSTLANDFDANGNGKFEAAEIRALRDGAFVNLANYGFFTLLRKGEKRSSPVSRAVSGFTASIRDKRVVYRFRVDLSDQALGNDFNVAIFDVTYFCAVRYPKDAAMITGKETDISGISWERAVNRKFPVYYNPMGSADDGTVYTSPKPGLETAWPEEIHVKPRS